MRFRWAGLLVAIVAVVTLIVLYRPSAPVPPPPATQEAVTRPVTRAVVAVDDTPRRLFDVLKDDFPAIAATQPLGTPLDLNDAARMVVERPIYLDPGADVWITHPQGESVQDELKRMDRRDYKSDGSHVVREIVRFIYWMNDEGRARQAVFVHRPDNGDLEVVTVKARLTLPKQRNFQFHRALPMRDFLAIPCDDGVAVFTITPTSIAEQFVELPAGKDTLTAPQVVLASRGLLAWTPASAEQPGSHTYRWLDGQWTKLEGDDWPLNIVQLSPFLDGTVQQLRLDGDKLQPVNVTLDVATTIDEKQVLDLIDKLGDLSEKNRNQAFRDLQRVGPAAWPIAEKHYENQLPEVQQRLDTLLKARLRPSIGNMTSLDGKLIVVDRFHNGGILVYGDAGVSIPVPGRDEPVVVQPAWICIRPDAGPELLNERLVRDLRPGAADLVPYGNEWILVDPIRGPQRFVGNALLPLLRKSEVAYSQLLGSDWRGRTLYRKPATTQPTLLIDPTLPDPTPRLPVWTIRNREGSTGWSSQDWPAIKRADPWELRERGWQVMDKKTTAYFTSFPPDHAATQPSDPVHGRLLLTDRDGVQYYGGKESLILVTPSPTTQPAATQPATITWPLPENATGRDPVTLLQSPDGRLWLFNQPGRVLRLAKTGDPADPLKLEATFTRNIPNTDEPRRIWIDPAGRICFLEGSNLAVMFTEGRIPKDIATRMSLEELQANEPE